MALIITWKKPQGYWRKNEGRNVWVSFSIPRGSLEPSSGNTSTLSRIDSIKITVPGLGSGGWYNNGTGESEASFYTRITLPNGTIYTSNTHTFKSDADGYAFTKDFTISGPIIASGSAAVWDKLEIVGKFNSWPYSGTNPELWICRGGGNITITYNGQEGCIRYYDGAQFINCAPQYYDGEKWVPVSASYYDGAKWNPVG